MTDNKELNNTVKRLGDILSRLENTIFKNYNGGSGGVGKIRRASATSSNRDSVSEKQRRLEIERNQQIINSSTALKMLGRSFSSTFNIVEMYKRKIRDVYQQMDEQLDYEIENAEKFKQATKEYLKKYGLNNKAIYESSVQFNKLSNTAKNLSNSYSEYLATKQQYEAKNSALVELETKRRSETDTKQKNLLDKKIKELKVSLEKTKEAMVDSHVKFTNKLNDSSSVFGQLSKDVDATHPGFTELNDETIALIKGQSTSIRNYDDLNDQLKLLIKNSENYDRALITMSDGVADQLKKYQDNLHNLMRSLRATTATIVTSGTPKVIESILAQYRFGVKDSNYIRAGESGLADQEMSEILGLYQDQMRSLAGDFGVLRDPKVVVDKFLNEADEMGKQMGLTGPESAKFAANMMRMTFNMGLGAEHAQAMVKSMQDTAEIAGATPEEVAEYYEGLQDSNILQLMRRDIIDPEERRKAVQEDIAQTLRHGKVMGMTAKQTLEATKRMVEGSRYSSLEQAIRAKLTGRMAISQYGLNIDQEKYAQVQDKLNRGVTLRDDETAFMNAARLQIQQAAADKIETTGAQGMIMRQLLESMGQGAIPLGSDDLAQAQATKQVGIQTAGGAEALKDFMETGVIPATSKFVEVNKSLAELAGKTEEVNNSLALGMERFASSAANILRGISENPILGPIGLGGFLSGIVGIVTTGINLFVLYKLKKLAGLGSILPSGALIKKVSSGLFNIIKSMFSAALNPANLMAAGKFLLKRIVAPLGALFVGLDIGSWIYDKFITPITAFVDMFAGMIKYAMAYVKDKFAFFTFDDREEAQKEMAAAKDLMDDAKLRYMQAGLEAAQYVGMTTPEKAKAAKENLHDQIDQTTREAREKKVKEDEEYKRKMLEAAEKTAENTDKSTKIQEEEKKKKDEKLFSVRTLGEIEAGFAAINAERDQRVAQVTNRDNYR